MFTFIVAWITSRRYWLLPALLPLGLTAVFCLKILLEANRSHSQIVQSCLGAAEQAIGKQQWERADMLLRRVLTLNPRQQKAQSLQATMALDKGETEKATYWIQRVALGSDADAAKANIWLAGRALGAQDTGSQDGLRTAVGYLERAWQIQPKNVEVRIALAAAYVRLGLFDEAVRHYMVAAVQFPELHYDLARLYDQRGMSDEAKKSAARGIEEFSRRLKDNPFDYLSRQRSAYCMTLSWRYPEAVELLNAGLRLGGNETELKEDLSVTYSAWFEHLFAQEGTAANALPLLQEALRWNPRNMAACLRLMELVRDSQFKEQARKALEQSLAQGESSSLSHLILGTVDLLSGDQASATFHLEQAKALDERSPAVLNNLAFAMMLTDDQQQLVQALNVVDSALELAPRAPEIRETRGQILLRLGRHQEALVELEKVLPEFTRRKDLHASLPALHAALATIYDFLKQPTIAEEHRFKMKELTDSDS